MTSSTDVFLRVPVVLVAIAPSPYFAFVFELQLVVLPKGMCRLRKSSVECTHVLCRLNGRYSRKNKAFFFVCCCTVTLPVSMTRCPARCFCLYEAAVTHFAYCQSFVLLLIEIVAHSFFFSLLLYVINALFPPFSFFVFRAQQCRWNRIDAM